MFLPGLSRGKMLFGLLKKADDEKLTRMAEDKALKAFHRAAKSVPAYKDILQKADILPEKIHSIDEFKTRVPILDKFSTFAKYEIEGLCVGNSLDDVAYIDSSSGSSGIFSYGLLTKKQLKDTYDFQDGGLAEIFNIDKRKTLIINCMPNGQKVFSKKAIVIDNSVYSEATISCIKKFAHKFEQIILVGNHVFIKKIVEDGASQNIDWSSMLVHVILGLEILPENFRTYLARLLDIDLDKPETGILFSSGGIAEVFLHAAFFETLETIKIRRLAHFDPKLRHELFGETRVAPMIFLFNPTSVFIEIDPPGTYCGELVFSSIDLDIKNPLLRYKTGDHGYIFTHKRIKEALCASGYSDIPLPILKLPLLALSARKSDFMYNGQTVSPEPVKEALYTDFDLASSITGNFKIRKGDKNLLIDVQLKPGKLPQDSLFSLFEKGLSDYLNIPAQINFYKYEDFPYSMRLDYERKFAYLDDLRYAA